MAYSQMRCCWLTLTTVLWSYPLFKVEVGPNSSKEQLVHAVGRHFMSQVCNKLSLIKF
jgi:hypothetical protein